MAMIRRLLAAALGIALGAASAGAQTGFRFVDTQTHTDLLFGQDSLYRHMTGYDSTDKTKKVFHHVFGKNGDGFLTKGPGGLWGHHRGIMLGWSSVIQGGKDHNFWECPDGNTQRHERFLPDRELVAANLARRASVTAWMDPAGKAVVRDTREVTAWFLQPGILALDFAFSMKPEGAPVGLEATPHHGGISFRGIADVADSDYVMPADVVPEQAEVFKAKDDNAWVFARFAVKDGRYGVLYMDHPSNPRPTKMTHRDYGRFGAYYGAQVAPEQPLLLHGRWLVMDLSRNPDVTPARLKSLYDAYAKAVPAASIPSPEPVSTAALRPAGSPAGPLLLGLQVGGHRFRADGRRLLLPAP